LVGDTRVPGGGGVLPCHRTGGGPSPVSGQGLTPLLPSRRKATRSAADSSLQDDQLSSDEEFDSAYGPSSIASLLNEANLQTSSC